MSQIKTIADLMNIVNLDNHKRLSDDIAELLHSFAKIKAGEQAWLFVDNDYQITWIDDGKVESVINIKILDQ